MKSLNPAALFAKLAGLLFRQLPVSDEEIALEYEQTINRMYNLVFISIYIIVTSIATSSDRTIEPWALTILGYYTVYTSVAVVHMQAVKKYPGHYPARRIFIMAHDLGSLAFSIIVNWSTMLPLYAIIVWVTLGNGARYGARYLLLATIMAQLALLAIYWFTPFLWQFQAVAVTLSLTALLIPFYARSLVEDVRKAKLAAEEASVAKSRFLAQASHDLRQPVHAIGLFLHKLKISGLRRDQEAIVGRIERSLRGVAGLFKSLLDISTLDSGTLAPSYEQVSIGSLFDELEQQNRSSWGWAGSNLRFVPTKYVVRTDRAFLSTMVQNLISNAVKYAPNGPILVGCRRQGGSVSIVVYDSGDGIAAEHIPHLFDEFYQVRKIGNPDTQGVGLGLSIVKRLALLMGLDVAVRSREGQGTAVTISGLKRVQAPVVNATKKPDSIDRRPLLGLRVILIEDDSDILDATAELIESWGCAVEAHSGIPATIENCDLIIADFDIGGGVTGWEATVAIREMVAHAVPAIVLTGHDQNKIADIVDDAAVPILKKPVSPDELRLAIGSLAFQPRKSTSALQEL